MVADREQFPLHVEQEPEIHLHRVRVRTLGDCLQPLRIELGTGWILQHLVARLLEGDQVSREVPAVHGRDIAGFQNAKLVQIVPVEEMAVETPHPLERPEYFLHAVDHVRSGDEAEIRGAHRREELEADVGR